jgi:hypothetical protein
MPKQDADIFEVLIGQMAECYEPAPFSAKRSAYSDFWSQSAICCIGGTTDFALSVLDRH